MKRTKVMNIPKGYKYITNGKRGNRANSYKVLRIYKDGHVRLLSRYGVVFTTHLENLALYGYGGQNTRPSTFPAGVVPGGKSAVQ